MKGITPVIAVILLLLITISLVGFAFIFFTRITETTSEQIDTQLEQQLLTQQQRVSIEAINRTHIFVRSTGTASIPGTSLVVFVNNSLRNCVFTTTIAPGGVASCNLTFLCGNEDTIRVTAPGGSDSRDCG